MRTVEGVFDEHRGTLHWYCNNTASFDLPGLIVEFPVYADSENAALRMLATRLQLNELEWLKPLNSPTGDWLIDLDLLKRQFPNFLRSLGWLKGRTKVSPEYISYQRPDDRRKVKVSASVRFLVTLADLSYVESANYLEVSPYLDRFRLDHPDPNKCAFLAMKFEKTRLHNEIVQAVRDACGRHGIQVLRADDKRYASQLWLNVQTYMHGCNWGIAVFERLTDNDFNPNVSLEIGYMISQGKHVCLLKDSTLPALQTDLMGHLYDEFDTQNPSESIPPVMDKWIRNLLFSQRAA